jgi:DNA-binding transcriptional regulator LsrR (DeoR family)
MANAMAGQSVAAPAQEGARRSAPRRDLLIQVAKLYFYEGLSQAQIAAKIGVSRSNISKLLQAGKESRIIERWAEWDLVCLARNMKRLQSLARV